MFVCGGKKKSQKVSELIQNQNLLRLRLSHQEKLYYKSVRIPKKLYNKHQKKIAFMIFQMFQMVM